MALTLIRYAISGGLGAVVQSAFLYVWVSVLGLERDYLWGAVLGFCIALAVSFSLQKYWTFRNRMPGTVRRQFTTYGMIAVLNLVLITLSLEIARNIFTARGLDFFDGWYLLVQLVVIAAVSVMSFYLNSLFTFKNDAV